MMRRRIVATGMLILLLLAASPCLGQSSGSPGGYGRDFGYGTLAVFTNVLYMPVKTVYAVLGTVTGGLAYLLTAGNSDVAQSVLSPALGGTYVVTPAMFRGEEEFLFSGPSHEPG